MSKVLCFGSINIDHVYNVKSILRPGETQKGLSLTDFPGGKGMNQSVALSRAGSEVFHAGKVGPDGIEIISFMKEHGIRTDYVEDNGSITGHTVIQVDKDGENCILLYPGANGEIDKYAVDEALSHFEKGDVIVLQNEINNIPHIIEKAHGRGLRIALTPAPFTDDILEWPLDCISWFLVNSIEGAAITGKSEPQEICDEMLRKFPRAAIVLTLGSEGAWYADASQRYFTSSFHVNAIDTTAAGDTFAGFFITGILEGLSVPDSLQRAAAASAISVTRKGAAVSVPTREEVAEFLCK